MWNHYNDCCAHDDHDEHYDSYNLDIDYDSHNLDFDEHNLDLDDDYVPTQWRNLQPRRHSVL